MSKRFKIPELNITAVYDTLEHKMFHCPTSADASMLVKALNELDENFKNLWRSITEERCARCGKNVRFVNEFFETDKSLSNKDR